MSYIKWLLVVVIIFGLGFVKFQCERHWNYSLGYEDMVKATIEERVKPLEQRILKLENEKL